MTDPQHRGAAWPIIPGEIPPFHSHPDRACAGKDTRLFFPEHGGASALRAVAVCRECPILDMCRDWSLNQPPQLRGIWGGLTDEDRYRVRAGRPLPAKSIPATFRPPPPAVPSHASARRVRREVAALDAAGYSIEAIAGRVGCSYRTVQRHLRALRDVGQVAA